MFLDAAPKVSPPSISCDKTRDKNIPLAGSTLMMDSSAKTLEQQPPKISDSMAPTASHCGMVSMNMRPATPMARLKTGRLSSMPYISAFSSEGAALMTRGDGAAMANALSARSLLLGGVCWCLCSAGRRRAAVMAGRGVAARGPSARYGHIQKKGSGAVGSLPETQDAARNGDAGGPQVQTALYETVTGARIRFRVPSREPKESRWPEPVARLDRRLQACVCRQCSRQSVGLVRLAGGQGVRSVL